MCLPLPVFFCASFHFCSGCGPVPDLLKTICYNDDITIIMCNVAQTNRHIFFIWFYEEIKITVAHSKMPKRKIIKRILSMNKGAIAYCIPSECKIYDIKNDRDNNNALHFMRICDLIIVFRFIFKRKIKLITTSLFINRIELWSFAKWNAEYAKRMRWKPHNR